MRGLSFYQWDDEPIVNRGGGTKRYSGWQTGLRFNDGKPKPVLSTFPAPFVIERKGKAKSVRLWGQVRPNADPTISCRSSPRARPTSRDVAPVTTSADGTWTYRLTIQTGAAYRYRWTPAPTLTVAAPAPSFSGIVEPSKSAKTDDAGRLIAVKDASEDPAAFYTAGYSLADHEEGMKMGRWRALGARTKAAHARTLAARAGLAPRRVVEIGCGDGSLLLALSEVWRRRHLRRLRALAARRSRSPAGAGSRAPGGSRPTTARAFRPRTALTTSRCSRTCSSTSPTRRRCCAEAARVARRVLVEVPLEDNRSAARPAKRAEAARIGHLHAFNRADVRAWSPVPACASPASSATPSPSPPRVLRRGRRGAGEGRGKWAVRAGAWRVAPLRAERSFTMHYAVLATPA